MFTHPFLGETPPIFGSTPIYWLAWGAAWFPQSPEALWWIAHWRPTVSFCCCGFVYTPEDYRLEHNHGGLEDNFPFQRVICRFKNQRVIDPPDPMTGPGGSRKLDFNDGNLNHPFNPVFKLFFYFSVRSLGKMNPFWLICFKWVETTN